jgi:RNA polymerase sigma factor (sigma-70 family)
MSPSIPLRVLRTQSDARLVEFARGGHERAFEALVHRYRKPLLGYCRRMLLPEARAEDALQQGLLQAWLALRDGGEVRDAKAWLYRIVHNAAISALRRSGYDYVELDESLHGASAPESDIDRRIAVREALAGLAALPEAQREVLLRTAIQGHTHEQVAAALGLSDGAVRGLIYRARATLRAAATAFTPPQIVIWAARAAESGSAHPQLAEIAGGAGSAGLLGVLLKGGPVVASIGVLTTGTGLIEHGGGANANARPAAARRLGDGAPGPRRSAGTSAALSSQVSATELFGARSDALRAARNHAARTRSATGHRGAVPGRDHGHGGGQPTTGRALDGSPAGSGGGPGSRGDGGATRGLPGPSGSGDGGERGRRSDGGSEGASGSSGSGTDGKSGGASGADGAQAVSTAPAATAESAPANPSSGGDGGQGGGETGPAHGGGSPAESGSGH